MAIIVPDYFGEAFSRSYLQAQRYAQQEAERKRQEEQNKMLGQMYLESMRAPADAAVAPYQANAIANRENAYDKQVRAEASGMTDALMANNPALTSRVAGVSPAPTGYTGNIDLSSRPSVRQPDGSMATVASMGINIDGKEVLIPTVSDDGRMLTPEQAIAQFKATGKHLGMFNTPEESTAFAKALSAQQGQYYGINNNFRANNQANMAQADNQAQSAEQMLAMAKEKYGTAMFDRLAPIVASGKVPAQAMIAIIEKQVQTAEKQALKQAQSNAYKQAMELMKQGKVDEAKMVLAEYMPPEAQGRMMASVGQNNSKLSIAPDGRVVDMRTGLPVQGTPTYAKPDKPAKPTPPTTREVNGVLYEYNPANGQWLPANIPDNNGKNTWEKEHRNYEKTHGMTDAQLVNEYWAMSQDPVQSALITPDKQAKYNVATARVNKYLAQPNLTADEQEFLSGIDRSKVSKEEGFKMLQQYRMNKLNGIRQ